MQKYNEGAQNNKGGKNWENIKTNKIKVNVVEQKFKNSYLFGF